MANRCINININILSTICFQISIEIDGHYGASHPASDEFEVNGIVKIRKIACQGLGHDLFGIARHIMKNASIYKAYVRG